MTWKFTLTVSDVPTTLGSTPAVKCYQDGSNVEFTGGITLTPDYDGKTGLCELIVDTSNAAYSAGHFYDFIITAGAIGIVSPIGYVVGHFELIPEPADLRAVNGGSTGATASKLELAQLKVAATGSDNAIDIASANGNTINLVPGASGSGVGLHIAVPAAGEGVTIYGPSGSYGIDIETGASALFITSSDDDKPTVLFQAIGDSNAFLLESNGATSAVVQFGNFTTGSEVDIADYVADFTVGMVHHHNGAGIAIFGPNDIGNGAGPGLQILPGDTTQPCIDLRGSDIVGDTWSSKAINALGQVYIAPTNTNDDALVLLPNGTGLSINAPVESGVDLISSLKLANAANAGKTDGMGGVLVHLRDAADTLNRVTATVDANGNRTAITLNLA